MAEDTGTQTQDKTFTQDDVNSFVAAERKKGQEKLEAIEREHTTALEGITKERDDLAAFKTGADKLIADSKAEVEQASLKAQRYEIALDKGLPKSLADRLRGDDAAAMQKDADELAELVKQPKESKLAGGPGEGTTREDDHNDMNVRIRRAANRA